LVVALGARLLRHKLASRFAAEPFGIEETAFLQSGMSELIMSLSRRTRNLLI